MFYRRSLGAAVAIYFWRSVSESNKLNSAVNCNSWSIVIFEKLTLILSLSVGNSKEEVGSWTRSSRWSTWCFKTSTNSSLWSHRRQVIILLVLLFLLALVVLGCERRRTTIKCLRPVVSIAPLVLKALRPLLWPGFRCSSGDDGTGGTIVLFVLIRDGNKRALHLCENMKG